MSEKMTKYRVTANNVVFETYTMSGVYSCIYPLDRFDISYKIEKFMDGWILLEEIKN